MAATSSVASTTMNAVHPHNGDGGHQHTSELSHSKKVEDQAATAALYVTSKKHTAPTQDKGSHYMDGDKLSSAGQSPGLICDVPTNIS